jgi:phage I-like protein
MSSKINNMKNKKIKENLKRKATEIMDKNILIRSLSEVKFEFKEGEMTSRIQVLPFGKWKHPSYGEIKIEEKDLENFVFNFEGQVRKELPITEGHSVGEQELPAIGWFKQLENKGRDGLWAVVEWTNEGISLLKEKAYKYFSPEFYSVYEDPETHKIYHDVLVGGALTNRPYFKGLQAVMLSEFTSEKTMTIEEILAKKVEELSDEEKSFLKDNAETLSDEQKETYKDIVGEKKEDEKEVDEVDDDEDDTEDDKGGDEDEGGDENKGSEKMVKMSESSLKILEKNAKAGVQALALLRRSAAEVYAKGLIFSESNKSASFLPKSQSKIVDFLLSLNEKQQKDFKEILGELPKSKLFSEIGEGSGAQASASEQILKFAEALMLKDSKLTLSQATVQALSENPELAAQAEQGE